MLSRQIIPWHNHITILCCKYCVIQYMLIKSSVNFLIGSLFQYLEILIMKFKSEPLSN